ncbi:MAG: DUF3373 domain-containing protein [Deltaproteobacteria bacterium]|nr:DUF3373 domain-containing protein [Deltaproteobacteria bacterium]
MEKIGKRNAFLWAFALIFLAWASLPSMAFAEDDITSIKNEVKALEKKIEKLEKANSWNSDDIGDLGKRLDKAEMHTASDKISFSVDFRTKAESIHYNDLQAAPAALVGGFFTPITNGGFYGGTLAQIQGGIGAMVAGGMVPPTEKYDADNNIIYTNKFRLNMKANVNPHLSFSGRLAAYKVFGDSTGVKFNQGSLGDVTLDGNTSSLPHGDIIRMERAYFVYKNDIGSDIYYHLSLGRRPSTDGPPLEYRNYGLVGGSPLAHIINWQFDGASLGFNFGDAIGIPGASFKLCYGLGFENDYGNSTTLGYNGSSLSDVHLLGFIANLYNNGTTRFMVNYAHAGDITDGFTGLTVMPFIVSKQDKNQDGTPEYYFDQNNGGFITRMEPMTNIGDWDAATLLLSSKLDVDTGYDGDGIDWFLSGAWSHTNPSQISNNPFYEIMGMGLLSSNGQLKKRAGYSIYAGTVLPMPHNGRLGLEYNWGSKYWFNFTGAEDSLIGSKLAVRGQVYEGYYIQPLYGHNFFAKVGTQFYDYKYTGSGNPLGAPVKISSLSSLDALNPVADKIWNYYASVTLRF